VSTLALVAAEAEVVTELPIEPIAYGVVAFCALTAALVITYAFKSVRTRH